MKGRKILNMILYHGTTSNRAAQIFRDKKISNNCKRFFTEELNGDGSTTQGYVYLTNEITYAVYFANCHHFVDKSNQLYIFRVEVSEELIEPDYDEMRYQDPLMNERNRYTTDLKCSLLEFKSCRIPLSIEFDKFSVEYFVFNRDEFSDIAKLFDNAGCDYKYVVTHYSEFQHSFIDSIQWKKVVL